MDTEEIIIISKNFYYGYTYLAWAIVAGLLVFVLLINSVSILGKSSSTGMSSKKDMINQTRDKME
jgi:hypothetical protein